MDYGIKVSKPGTSVLTAADKDLYYSSEFDSLKASWVGSTTITFLKTAVSTNLDLTHGLGYAPAYFVLVYVNGSADAAPLPYVNLFGELDTRVATVAVFSDTTKVRITVNGFVAAYDLPISFKWYIYHNQLD